MSRSPFVAALLQGAPAVNLRDDTVARAPKLRIGHRQPTAPLQTANEPLTDRNGRTTRHAKRIVFGVMGNDTHVVANRILELGLRELGYRTCNLRTDNDPDDFADAALETAAHAVLVSSLNGEGEHWCRDFRAHFVSRGLDRILLYIGGNLVVGDRPRKAVEAQFRGYGFDRVFYRPSGFGAALDALATDLEAHG